MGGGGRGWMSLVKRKWINSPSVGRGYVRIYREEIINPPPQANKITNCQL